MLLLYCYSTLSLMLADLEGVATILGGRRRNISRAPVFFLNGPIVTYLYVSSNLKAIQYHTLYKTLIFLFEVCSINLAVSTKSKKN